MDTLLLINWIAFIGVTAYAIFLFVQIVRTRIAYIKMGKKVDFDQDMKQRVRDIITFVFGQKKLLKDKKSGAIHVMMFYGFLLVQFGAIDFIWKGLAPDSHLPLGFLYPGFTFFQELVTLTILVAVVWAFYRRYIEKLVRLKRGFKAGLVLIFIGTLMLSVLMGNGAGIVWHGHELTWTEPVASMFALLFGWMGTTAAATVFYVMWWIHLFALLSFLIYVPQSKHAHLIAGPANVFLTKDKKHGKLKKIDFDIDEMEESDEEPTFGVGKVEDLDQLQLLDLYACVECGRCTNVCPASGSGKMLSPMDIIVKLRDHLTEKGAAVTGKSAWVPSYAFAGTQGNQVAADPNGSLAQQVMEKDLIGDVVTEEELWACTTCRNCEDACPVMNQHVDTIIDLRRYLVMTEGKMDPEAQRAMMNIERQGNPWGLSKKDRENWREVDETLRIPTVKEMKKEGEEFEYLFWVSSMGSYDNRSQKIALAFARLMNKAGVKFAILGNKERNSGDTARRLGNEFLFQELAEKNIKEFEKNEVTKIVTIDPHAYNIFKNEYPDFGFEGEVYHHTELLAELLEEGRLKPEQAINEKITYHDSCYLGRYNDVYNPPRTILESIPGVQYVEIERNKENGMCCGAGGGMMWSEEKTGNRVNVARTEQALEVTPNTISSACPYCLTMLTDGTKAKEVEEDVTTQDVAEVLERSIFGEPAKIDQPA
ncbi:4Fe-4S dicluster domain-containing protein [Filobacillus milosensis]|uniref:4Fe-4S dicluster domain-containing protein n=1 Tax=Filobacillus milosensis TaxID=94137 RepID=A0A4Y8IFF9_9BACI|nr:(Fe-S)-binding protein [Filobacillus milosensis]TFB19213.1 4Fe-4S dicluster domain-containing protein [Filobacillus milosensis]